MRSPAAVAAAWAVHAYTASGAICGFAAVLAILDRDYRAAFVWLGVSTIIDATDGVLARMADVKTRTPTFDGARLDDIVDYLTYVFAPVLLLYVAGTLPQGWGLAIAAAVLLSSAYGFASTDAKTDDYFFTGFPSYWNVVAIYLFAGRLTPMVNAAILLTLSVLVFVRIGYVYPSRTPILRGLTSTLAVIWAAMMLVVISQMPDVSSLLLIVSLFFPVYYLVLSLALHRRRRRT
jgi:phosphatidylcholine synthase